jgi:predicted ATPase
MRDSLFIRRVVLENFKSIAACDVRLGPLNFLVGPNGAGKSNFLDALRLVADSLDTSLRRAIADRGGPSAIFRHTLNGCDHCGIRLEFSLDQDVVGSYAFRVTTRGSTEAQKPFEVEREECVLQGPLGATFYKVVSGRVEGTLSLPQAVAPDRLYLGTAAGTPEFRPVFEALGNMVFYEFDLNEIREIQPITFASSLARNGHNLASVLALLGENAPHVKRRIEEYLELILPGSGGIDVKDVNDYQYIRFLQKVAGTGEEISFHASDMSDGTLRALCIVVALLSPGSKSFQHPRLIGFEEPETCLHPAAVGVLLDCLREASEDAQVIVTSHSPDLLDDKDIDSDSILAVVSEHGLTRIGPIDAASRSALHERLYTPGELLRINQIAPDQNRTEETVDSLPSLFDEVRV